MPSLGTAALPFPSASREEASWDRPLTLIADHALITRLKGVSSERFQTVEGAHS